MVWIVKSSFILHTNNQGPKENWVPNKAHICLMTKEDKFSKKISPSMMHMMCPSFKWNMVEVISLCRYAVEASVDRMSTMG